MQLLGNDKPPAPLVKALGSKIIPQGCFLINETQAYILHVDFFTLLKKGTKK